MVNTISQQTTSEIAETKEIEEEGRYPDTIIELMSPSTANVDLGLKKQLYDRIFKTQDYFVYNPFDPNSLQGWHRNNDYQAIAADERGWLWCESLGLWLGTWQGTIDRETLTWLRFYERSGALVLLPEEAAQQRAEAEAQRAERFVTRLRELGEDPDSL